MFTDVVGSTERAASLGDLKWKDLLQAHDVAVRRQIRNFEGQVVNTTGDGFLLAFSGPTRAIQCTDAIRADLKPLGLDIRAGGTCLRPGHRVAASEIAGGAAAAEPTALTLEAGAIGCFRRGAQAHDARGHLEGTAPLVPFGVENAAPEATARRFEPSRGENGSRSSCPTCRRTL